MVVRALILFAILFQAATASIGNAAVVRPEAALASGRASLERGDLEEAQKFYSSISFQSPLWREKAEDLLRYHLIKGEGNEAWRIVQVLRRIKVNIKDLDEYERLAVFLAGGCPLQLPGADGPHGRLLDAATFRFHSTMLSEETQAAPEKIEGASLAPGLQPFLADIPRTSVLRGQGCRFVKLLLKSETGAANNELELLQTSLSDDAGALGGNASVGTLLLLSRALQLAIQTSKDQKVIEGLRAKFPVEAAVPWRELPGEERRILFTSYFSADSGESVAASKKAAAQRIAVEVLSNTKDPKDADWLSFVDLASLSSRSRVELLSSIEKTGAFSGRGWVLLELARSRYELGETSESLTVLRRLLLEHEEAANEGLDLAALDLASRIYSDHRLDERLLGMMQSALPARLWAQLLESAAIRFAIYGRATEFSKATASALKKVSANSLKHREFELWKAIARRDSRAFKTQLQTFSKTSSAARVLQSFAGQIVNEEIAHPDIEGLTPFASSLAEELRVQSARVGLGTETRDRLIELASLLEKNGEWAVAGASVRKGVINVGTAEWKEGALKPAVFRLRTSAPRLRELFFRPVRATARDWTLSTVSR